MPADKKPQPDKGKPASGAAAKPQVVPAKQITIQLPSLTLDFGPHFELKLAILGFAVLLFAFALFLFARSNFALGDVFDYSRIEFNAGKLYSVNFILFLFLYSLSMALVIAYGAGLPKLQAAIPLVVLFLVALIESLFFGPFQPAFISFGIALGAAAFAASFAKEITPSSAWNITAKALTVLVLLSFVFTYMRVDANKDFYFDTLILGVVNQAPELLASAAPAGAQQAAAFFGDQIKAAQVKPEQLAVLVPEEGLSTALDDNAGSVYTALPQSAKDEIISSAHDYCLAASTDVANKMKDDIATVLKSNDASQFVSAGNVSEFVTPEIVRQQLQAVPQTRLLYSYLPLMAALTVSGVMSMVNIAIHIIATILAWVLAKFVL